MKKIENEKKRFKNPVYVDFSKSPKLLITSNYPITFASAIAGLSTIKKQNEQVKTAIEAANSDLKIQPEK